MKNDESNKRLKYTISCSISRIISSECMVSHVM